jgi:2'-5' RNA ligase
MRIFIAIEIPVPVKELVARLQAKLREHTAAVSWTRPENLHLTLKFLGEIDAERLPVIEEATMASVEHIRPLSLRLDRVGVFPNARNPRVLWIGLGGDVDKVPSLAARLDQKLVERGLAGEKRPFQPHLTIGRFKGSGGAPELLALARDYRLPETPFLANELVVMHSKLMPKGAEHMPLVRASLTAE